MNRHKLSSLLFALGIVLFLLVTACVSVFFFFAAFANWWAASSPGHSSDERRAALTQLGDMFFFFSVCAALLGGIPTIRLLVNGRFQMSIRDLVTVPVVGVLLVAIVHFIP